MAGFLDAAQQQWQNYQNWGKEQEQQLLAQTGMRPDQLNLAMGMAIPGSIASAGRQLAGKAISPLRSALEGYTKARGDRLTNTARVNVEAANRVAGKTPMGLRDAATGRMTSGLQQANTAVNASGRANMTRLGELGLAGGLGGAGVALGTLPNSPMGNPTGVPLEYLGENDPANMTDMNYPAPPPQIAPQAAPRPPTRRSGRKAGPSAAQAAAANAAQAQAAQLAAFQQAKQQQAQDYYMSRLNPLGGTSEYADLQRGHLNDYRR